MVCGVDFAVFRVRQFSCGMIKKRYIAKFSNVRDADFLSVLGSIL